jgi:hypothetical protein
MTGLSELEIILLWFLLASTGSLRIIKILDESTSHSDIVPLRRLALAHGPALSFAYQQVERRFARPLEECWHDSRRPIA